MSAAMLVRNIIVMWMVLFNNTRSCSSLQLWDIIVTTRNGPNSETDATVHLNITDSSGFTQYVSLGNSHPRGSVQTLSTELSIGVPVALFLKLDNKNGWRLKDIILTNTKTHTKYTFYCGCWIDGFGNMTVTTTTTATPSFTTSEETTIETPTTTYSSLTPSFISSQETTLETTTAPDSITSTFASSAPSFSLTTDSTPEPTESDLTFTTSTATPCFITSTGTSLETTAAIYSTFTTTSRFTSSTETILETTTATYSTTTSSFTSFTVTPSLTSTTETSPNPTAENHSTTTNVQNIVYTSVPSCHCACLLPQEQSVFNITNSELMIIVESLKNELKVDKATLSSTTRKLTSARDDRTSSKAAGYVGCAILASLGILLIIVDFPVFVQHFTFLKRNLQRR